MDDVYVSLEAQQHTKLILSAKRSSGASFFDDEAGWKYATSVLIQKNRVTGLLCMKHDYSNGNDGETADEIVSLNYSVKEFESHPNDIALSISLKTGLAWKTYEEEQAEVATDEQIELMITHLKISIKKIKNRIIRNMVNM